MYVQQDADVDDNVNVPNNRQKNSQRDKDEGQPKLYGASSENHVELERAQKALLDHDFISLENEIFPLISYHCRALQDWHHQHTGWKIERYQDTFFFATLS